MVDLHAHILPGFDDGAPDLQASIELARAAVEDGTHTMVATPHVSLTYDATPSAIAAGLAVLSSALAEQEIDLDVTSGAEVAVERLAELDDAILAELCIGEGPYLLVESPYSASPFLESLLFSLRTQGFRPLLAHPERCPTFQRDVALLERLVAQGALCSVTAGSLTGRFGRTVQRFTRELFRAELVHDISSDAHNTRSRPPGLSEGLQALESDLSEFSARSRWYADSVPAAIVGGQPLPPRPPLASRPRRRWSLPGGWRASSGDRGGR